MRFPGRTAARRGGATCSAWRPSKRFLPRPPTAPAFRTGHKPASPRTSDVVKDSTQDCLGGCIASSTRLQKSAEFHDVPRRQMHLGSPTTCHRFVRRPSATMPPLKLWDFRHILFGGSTRPPSNWNKFFRPSIAKKSIAAHSNWNRCSIIGRRKSRRLAERRVPSHLNKISAHFLRGFR
jgi:hypothetical protein